MALTGLETPRLLLRPPMSSDAAAFFDFLGDPVAIRLTQRHPSPRSCARRIAAFEWQRRRVGYAPWAIIRRDDGQLVGWGGVYVDPFYCRWGPELGYALHPTVWGQGYATEISLACLDWADHVLDVAEIVGFAHLENRASRRVLEKTGFHEGRYVADMNRLIYSRLRWAGRTS